MRIVVANNIGFCFGVKRSIDITERALREHNGKDVYVTGDLVHNEKVMDDLKDKGLKILNMGRDKLTEIPKNSVIIVRAHGLPPYEIENLKCNFNEVIDTTCPIVKKMFEIAVDLTNEERDLFVLGNKNHPEMIALRGYVKKALFFSTTEELKKILDEEFQDVDKDKKIGLISQTTKDLHSFCEASCILAKHFKDLKVVRTICDFTIDREREVESLAKTNDLVIVVGSNKSSNTKKLFKIASRFTNTLFISAIEQLDNSLKKFENIAIVSGTSTPINLIEEVVLSTKNKFGEVEVLW